MNKKDAGAVETIFGKQRLIEDIRTNILFVRPYGSITIPDIRLAAGLTLCVARVPDEDFYTGCYWANYGPKPSDDDLNVFVVPVVIKPWMRDMCGNWAQIKNGTFVTTDSGVIVLDVKKMWAWEGYECPGKRDYEFDRRRLEKSAAALKTFAGTP